MEIEKIKEKIKVAEKAVENVLDPSLKSKAFEVVLNNLLKVRGPEARSEINTNVIPNENHSFSIKKLCQESNLNEQQLKQIFEFENDKFTIITNIPGNKESRRQQNASLVILTVTNYLYGSKEIKTSELKEYLRDLGIRSLVNLSTHLKSFENYILKKGRGGGKNVIYRITTPGLMKGIELIRQMAGEINE